MQQLHFELMYLLCSSLHTQGKDVVYFLSFFLCTFVFSFIVENFYIHKNVEIMVFGFVVNLYIFKLTPHCYLSWPKLIASDIFMAVVCLVQTYIYII